MIFGSVNCQNMRIDISPNPFSKQTRISFSKIARAEDIELRIYDVTGKLIKSFGKLTNHPSSINQIVWDGRDDKGAILPSGTYLFLIDNQGAKETRNLNFIH